MSTCHALCDHWWECTGCTKVANISHRKLQFTCQGEGHTENPHLCSNSVPTFHKWCLPRMAEVFLSLPQSGHKHCCHSWCWQDWRGKAVWVSELLLIVHLFWPMGILLLILQVLISAGDRNHLDAITSEMNLSTGRGPSQNDQLNYVAI